MFKGGYQVNILLIVSDSYLTPVLQSVGITSAVQITLLTSGLGERAFVKAFATLLTHIPSYLEYHPIVFRCIACGTVRPSTALPRFDSRDARFLCLCHGILRRFCREP